MSRAAMSSLVVTWLQRQSLWLAATALAACSYDGGLGSGIVFNDFQDEVRSTAGPGAADCGQVRLRDDRSTANCCVATNFEKSLPFSVTYDEQGIDSFVARGLALDSGGRLTEFLFDSDPTGGARTDNGVINSHTCGDPTLTRNPCSDPTGFPIVCN